MYLNSAHTTTQTARTNLAVINPSSDFKLRINNDSSEAHPAFRRIIPLKRQPSFEDQLIEKAKSLLAEAGWTDSNGNGIVDKVIDGELTEMTLEFLYTPTVPFQDGLTALVQESAKQAGIDIQRVGMGTREVNQKLRQRDYEMAGSGAGSNPIPDDPSQYWHCDSARPGGSNYSGYCSEEADAIIDAIRASNDLTERIGLYKQLQAVIYEDQPVVFLFSPMNKIIVHNRFKDPVISNFKMGVSLQHLHK